MTMWERLPRGGRFFLYCFTIPLLMTTYYARWCFSGQSITVTTTTTQEQHHLSLRGPWRPRNDEAGFLVVLDDDGDEQSSAQQALALAETLQKWRQQRQQQEQEDGSTSSSHLLELYYPRGALNYHLRLQLEAYHPLVTLTELDATADQMNNHTTTAVERLHRAALERTRFRYVTRIHPSVVWLRDPHDMPRWHRHHHHDAPPPSCDVSVWTVTTPFSWIHHPTPSSSSSTTTGRSICHVVPATVAADGGETHVPIDGGVIYSRAYQTTVARVYQSKNNNNKQWPATTWAYPTTRSPSAHHHHNTFLMLWIRSLLVASDDTNDEDDDDLVLRHEYPGGGVVETPLSREYRRHVTDSWRTRVDAARRVEHSRRGVRWAAFDGGLQTGVMNALSSARDARRRWKASVLTVDVVSTADGQLVAVHDDRSFFPDDLHDDGRRGPHDSLVKPISTLTDDEARSLTHACLSPKTRRALGQSPDDAAVPCPSEKIASVESFLDLIQDDPDVELIFDLKDATVERQLQQARILLSDHLSHKGRGDLIDRVAVRFFSAADSHLVASVVPERALRELMTTREFRDLRVYVNVPTARACDRFASWMGGSHGFLRRSLAGCFVVLDHPAVAADWRRFRDIHNVSDDAHHHGFPDSDVRMICDVPRQGMNARSLRDGTRECLEQGFDTIHHPFPIAQEPEPASSSSSTAAPPSSDDGLARLSEKALASIQGHLTTRVTRYRTLHKYPSMWSYYLPSSQWSTRQAWTFRSNVLLPNNHAAATTKAPFRCVTKVFSSMLLHNLEERGVLDLQERYRELSNHTLHEIITNIHPARGNRTDFFAYGSDRWANVSQVVEHATKMSFVDAMRYYVLEPMGIEGSFNENTKIPPYEARGFEGTLDDLLLLGSTLAAGGVSPKTHRQIISPQRLDTMMQDHTATIGNQTSFRHDPIVKLVERRYRGFEAPFHAVEGYGNGVWTVRGWRNDTQRNIRGWLCMGNTEALIYFDKTGLVVAMMTNVRTAAIGNILPPFARVVRDLGGHIDRSLLRGEI